MCSDSTKQHIKISSFLLKFLLMWTKSAVIPGPINQLVSRRLHWPIRLPKYQFEASDKIPVARRHFLLVKLIIRLLLRIFTGEQMMIKVMRWECLTWWSACGLPFNFFPFFLVTYTGDVVAPNNTVSKQDSTTVWPYQQYINPSSLGCKPSPCYS